MARLRWSFPVLALVLVGCAGTAAPTADRAGVAAVTPGSHESTVATQAAAPTGAGTKLQVTVPGLGGAPVAESDTAPAATGGDSPAIPTDTAVAASSTDAEDGVAVEASPAAPTSPAGGAGATVDVQLVGCGDCQVLGTHADVVAGYSAALISQGGRAAVISVDPAGGLVGIMAVPYGVTFAVQPGGRLACGAGGRCLVVAAQSDGRIVLSAFALGADGNWTDLSGSGGFVSATTKGLPVALEDALGAAVQVTDGTTTVWNVLAWNGSGFATLGCGPDGDTPDLATLELANCLS
ncbi:MAG: hypothetical protein ABJA16_08810 [Nakamurella sp.]